MKKIVTALLSMSLALSMAQTTYAWNNLQNISPDTISPNAYIECEEPSDTRFEIVENAEEVVSAVPLGIDPYATNSKTYRVTWTVKAGQT